MAQKVFLGTELKLNVNIEPVNGLTMDDFNFEVVVYCTPSKSLTIPKNDAVKIDSNNYVVLIDTRIVGAGDLKCKVSAFIDDPDFPDGYRTEIVVIDAGIKISNPL